MAYDSKAIANYFLHLAESDGKSLTPMKLQKLVYFAHGWHLAIKDGDPLIEEQVEAWKFGPVIPSLYRSFRGYGDQAVTRPAAYTRCYVTEGPTGYSEEMEIHEVVPSVDDDPTDAGKTKVFLDRIWKVYGDYSAVQLSNLTHQAGSPWDQVCSQYRGTLPRGTDIPPETMRDYFRSLARTDGGG